MSEKLERLGELPFWEWPVDGTQTVLDALSSESADERLLGAEIAFQAMSDAMAEALLALLAREEDDRVAAVAARSLGSALEACADEETAEADAPLTQSCFGATVDKLAAIYADEARPAAVRRAAMEAAAYAPQPWLREAIEGAATHADVQWRVSALFCMSVVPGFEEQLVAALDDEALEVRGQAMLSAAGRNMPQAAARTIEVAQDSEADVALRVVAIDALGQIASPEAAELLGKLSRDGDTSIAERAQLALDERAEAHMAADLHRVLDED